MSANDNSTITDSFMRIADVVKTTSLSRSLIYKKIKDGTFPAPRELGPLCVRWRQSEISAWIDQQPIARVS